MNLLIDIGHSRIKLGRTPADRVEQIGTYEVRDLSGLSQCLRALRARSHRLYGISTWHGEDGEQLQAKIADDWGGPERLIWISTEMAMSGLELNYTEPSTFGVDRLLALRAARARAGADCAVVDVGTAVTVDGLKGASERCGGWILPGSALMHRAVAELLGSPVTLARGSRPPVTSKSTAQAVNEGVWQTLAASVDHLCSGLRRLGMAADAPVFVTGGGAEYLQPLCRTTMIPVPDLVLEGIADYARKEGNAVS